MLGTFVAITALHSSRLQAEAAIGAAYAEVDRLSSLLNRFDSSTAIAQLNREGCLDGAPSELIEVVGRALHYFRLSGGCFDVSIQPVVDLFRAHHVAGEALPPAQSVLDEALALVDASNILLGPRQIRFARPGMGITLDGIAKGYIADRASAVLAGHGIRNHLVNAGGDICARGHAGVRTPWRVAIQDPRKSGARPAVINLTDGAVATSGNYEVLCDEERLYCHIANPITGLSPPGIASASLLAETAVEADALSTTAFLMEPETATRFVDSLGGAECLLLTSQNAPFLSRGWPSARI